jgi:hypothetical protein
MEGFNPQKLNDMEVKEQCQVRISNRFVALENLGGGGVHIYRTWEVLEREYKSFSHRESRLL